MEVRHHQDGELPERWEQHKEAIERLYVKDDLPIAEVVKRMEREYGFRAKPRHYIYRFGKWGFKRNIRAEVMILIAIIRERRRREEGKRTAFVYNGREVDEAKIDRYIRERNVDLSQMPLDHPTPAGLEYYTPMEPPEEPPTPTTEMPRIVLWVLGAARPLTYQDLGAACAIIDEKALFPNFHIPSREEVIAKSLGIIQIDPSCSVMHSVNAAGILNTLVPIDDANVVILETILKGVTQEAYLGDRFSKPLTRFRFESITPEALHGHPWYGFLQYATLYWATHLRRIREPLSPETEMALRLLISPPACLTWIEALAIFTGQKFRISLGRILGFVADFCRDGADLLTQETLACLQLWMSSCHELLQGWAEILERFPGEAHHIQGLFLSADSIFRSEYNRLNRHWALPACTSLQRQPLHTVLDEASRRTDYVSVLAVSKSRIYTVSRSRLRYQSALGPPAEEKPGFDSWSIRCISLETGTMVSEFRGQSPFGVVGPSWGGFGYVTAQLTLSDDSRYLTYQEYLEPDGIKKQYAFTYCWELQDYSTVDDDHFGPCTLINRGVPLHSPMRQTRLLTFCAGGATLVHANGKYDVKKQEPISPFNPPAIGEGVKVDSVHVSPDGNALVITRPTNGDSQSSQLELWVSASNDMPMTLSQTFRVPTPTILTMSRSCRFVAFTHKLLRASPNDDQVLHCNNDISSECESDDDSEYSVDCSSSGSRETHSLAILDTHKGSIGKLYSYKENSWDIGYDGVTRLRPDEAFFGRLEPSSSLFIARMRSGEKTPEGLIWRWSISGWINVGHIVFDWGCNSLAFNHDDSRLLGIRRDGLFRANVDNLEERVVAVETYSVRQEQEYHRSCWRDSSLYYLRSDINKGSTYKIAGYVWNLRGQPSVPLGEEISFPSPVSLNDVKDIWIPFPGDKIYFSTKGKLGSFCSRIDTGAGTGEDPSLPRSLNKGRIVAVASGGRCILTASFLRGGNSISSTSMVKGLQLRVCEGESSKALRVFSFTSCWSIVDERNRWIDQYRGVEATFHPSLPIMAWTFSWFTLGFWLASTEGESVPIFISETRSCRYSPSFSPCGRYFWAYKCGGLILFDLETGTRHDHSWPEELISHDAYSFCHGNSLFLVGFEKSNLVTAIAVSLDGSSNPLRRHLMTIPKVYQQLNTVKHCYITDDGRLKALVAHDSHWQVSADGPQSIQASFDLSPGWEDASSLITRQPRRAGPVFNTAQGQRSLTAPLGGQHQTQTLRGDIRSEKYWRCRKWSMVDAHGNLLLERKYQWL